MNNRWFEKIERPLAGLSQRPFRGHPRGALGVSLLVPEVGIEPTRTQGSLDFESSASTSFTTPAQDQEGQRRIKKNTLRCPKLITRDYTKIMKRMSISY